MSPAVLIGPDGHLPAEGPGTERGESEQSQTGTSFLHMWKNLEPYRPLRLASFQEKNWSRQFMDFFFSFHLLIKHSLYINHREMYAFTWHIITTFSDYRKLAFVSFSHLSNKYLLSICYMRRLCSGRWGDNNNKTKILVLVELPFQ